MIRRSDGYHSPIFWHCHKTQQRLTYKVQAPLPPIPYICKKDSDCLSVWVLCLQAPGDEFTDTSLSPDVSQKIGTITDPKNNVPGSTLWHWQSFCPAPGPRQNFSFSWWAVSNYVFDAQYRVIDLRTVFMHRFNHSINGYRHTALR